jgi:hypothetical protein
MMRDAATERSHLERGHAHRSAGSVCTASVCTGGERKRLAAEPTVPGPPAVRD